MHADQASISPGAVVTIDGELFRDGCTDEGGSEGSPPLTRIPIVWRQGGTESRLDEIDAAKDGTVRAVISIPRDAEPGRAELLVGTAPALVLAVAG